MSVRVLRRGAIAASRGAAATPTTYTIYPTLDGYIQSSHATYATARAGANLIADTTDTTVGVGQRSPFSGQYYVWEGFLSFDTSAVVGTITSATLSLYGQIDNSQTDFTLEARLHDWGATLEAGDFVAGTDLGSKTLLASWGSASGWSTAGYNALTSEAAFVSNINQSGFTRMVLAGSTVRTGTTPTQLEVLGFYLRNQTGTSQDPKLVIVTA